MGTLCGIVIKQEVNMKFLETKRLILSTWTRKDAADLYEYARNPNVGPHAGWKPHSDVRESRRIIKTIFRPHNVWAIRDRENGRAIGSIGFDTDKYRPNINSRELGYSVSYAYWCKVIMTEAALEVIRYGFETMKLDMICICTGPENKRSQSVIRKCGFTYEGMLRKAYRIYDGTLRDVLCHSLMKEEYYGN